MIVFFLDILLIICYTLGNNGGKIMNCCECEKSIDLTDHELKEEKAQWFGYFKAEKCIKVICLDCISDPEKKARYVNS